MILVSQFDHCLADLLYRWRHRRAADGRSPRWSPTTRRDLRRTLDLTGIPSTTCRSRRRPSRSRRRELWALIERDRHRARRARPLHAGAVRRPVGQLAGRCINIHHSFLPGFKGARPYHQAHERGVKLIGATAHYVTADLDEGPIIEQDVERISHRDTPDDLVRKGRDIERRVLARAVAGRWRTGCCSTAARRWCSPTDGVTSAAVGAGSRRAEPKRESAMLARSLAVAAALLLATALPATAAPARTGPKGLKLYAMDCGTFAVPDADMFSDDGAYKGVARTLIVPAT